MLTTYEEASRCPKCEQPGQLIRKSPVRGKRGVELHEFKCVTELCRWFETGWVVQVNADGSIPQRRPGIKEFEPLSPDQETRARDYLKRTLLEQGGNPDDIR